MDNGSLILDLEPDIMGYQERETMARDLAEYEFQFLGYQEVVKQAKLALEQRYKAYSEDDLRKVYGQVFGEDYDAL